MSDEDWRDRELRHGPDPEEREEEYVRWRLARHRDALRELAESAPVPWVAERCRELSRQIDTELGIDERRFTHSETPLPKGLLGDEDDRDDPPAPEPEESDGFDQLVIPREPRDEIPSLRYQETPSRRIPAPLVVIVSAIIFLGVIAALVWWTRPDEPPRERTSIPVSGPTIEVNEEIPPGAVSESPIEIVPEGHDFGLVFRGQRMTQTFSMRNVSDVDLDLRIQRSQCRCLWYQYDDKLEPGEEGSITISIDGGRAPSGRLRETVGIVLRNTDELIGEIHLTAEIE